jgi:hypothetical protein
VFIESGSSPVVSYSDIEGGLTGTGNIDADPAFVDPDGADNDPNTWEDNDYRLGAGSPCIDAGDNTASRAGVTTDLDGNPRFVDDPNTDPDTGNGTPPIVDMGAYEYQPSRGSPLGTPPPSDERMHEHRSVISRIVDAIRRAGRGGHYTVFSRPRPSGSRAPEQRRAAITADSLGAYR